MKLKEVTYTASGEYESLSHSRKSITLTAKMEEGDNFDDVYEELQYKAHSKLKDLDTLRQLQNKIQRAETRLTNVTDVYNEARKKFEEVKGIMKAAGINKNYPDFPDLSPKIIKALPSNYS